MKNKLKEKQDFLKADITITYEEYKNIKKYFPNYKIWTIFIVLLVLFTIFLLMPPEPFTILETLATDIIVFGFTFVFIKVKNLLLRRYKYRRLSNDEVEYTLYFYDDYFEKESENITLKIKYEDIIKVKEIDYTFYVFINKKTIITIPKESCNAELKSLIRDKMTIKKDKKNKRLKRAIANQSDKYKVMKIILLVLFTITLCTPWLALMVISSYIKYLNLPMMLMIDCLWIVLLLLPLPLSSVILGIIYKSKGLKCTKNIVVGIIMTILLLIIASGTYSEEIEKNYQDSKIYENVIGINLPDNGKYYKIKWDSSYLYDHVTSYIILKKDENEFYKSIKNNESWLQRKDINTNLSTLTNSLMCESTKNECYYSIYIKELELYNQIPNQTGDYHIYAMMYDADKKAIQIDEFTYKYIK